MKLLLLVSSLLLVVSTAAAQDSPQEPIPTEPPRLQSSGGDLKNAFDECKGHPSVVAAGTPFEVCMDSYGFVKNGDKWVHKPSTR